VNGTLTGELKEMLFGIEITLIGGFVFLLGLLTGIRVLWALGLIGGLFGFWLTVDAYTGSDADATARVESRDAPDEAD
jgi:hypothetical protein